MSTSPSAGSETGRLAAAAVGLVLMITALVVVGGAPAVAGPVDQGWTAAGPGATTDSDGSAAAASMSYDADGIEGRSATWSFTTTATAASAAGPIRVPYTWEGLHAWFRVSATPADRRQRTGGRHPGPGGPGRLLPEPVERLRVRRPGDVRRRGRRHLRVPAERLPLRPQQPAPRHVHPQHQAVRRPHHRPGQPPVDRCDDPARRGDHRHARRARRGALVPLPGRPRPARHRRPVPAPGRLRRRAVRRHRGGVRPAAVRLGRHPARGRVRGRRPGVRDPGPGLPRRRDDRAHLGRRAALDPVRPADLRPAHLRPPHLRPADLRPPDLRAADLCAADLRGRLLQPGPRRRRRLPRRVLGRPEPGPARGLGQHRRRPRARRRLDRQHGRVLLRPGAGARRRRLGRRPALPPRPCRLRGRRLRGPRGLRRAPHPRAHPGRRPHGGRHRHQQARDWPRGPRSARDYLAALGRLAAEHRRRGRRRAGIGPGARPAGAGRRAPGLPLRGEPARPRRQGDRRLLPQRRQQLRRDRGRRRGDPVLPLPRRLRPRPGEPVRAAGAARLALRRQPLPGPGAEPGRLRVVDRGDHRRGHPAGPRPVRRATGEDARGDRVDRRPLPRPARRHAADAHRPGTRLPGHRLRLPRRRRARCRRRVRRRPARRSPRHAHRRVRHAARPVVDRRRPERGAPGQPPRAGLPGRPLQRQRHAGRRLRDHPRRGRPRPGLRRGSERRGSRGHPRAQRRVPLRLQHRRRRRGPRRHQPVRLDAADGAAARGAGRRHRLPVRRHRLPRVQRAPVPRPRASPPRGTRQPGPRRSPSARRSSSPSRTTWPAWAP